MQVCFKVPHVQDWALLAQICAMLKRQGFGLAEMSLERSVDVDCRYRAFVSKARLSGCIVHRMTVMPLLSSSWRWPDLFPSWGRVNLNTNRSCFAGLISASFFACQALRSTTLCNGSSLLIFLSKNHTSSRVPTGWKFCLNWRSRRGIHCARSPLLSTRGVSRLRWPFWRWFTPQVGL